MKQQNDKQRIENVSIGNKNFIVIVEEMPSANETAYDIIKRLINNKIEDFHIGSEQNNRTCYLTSSDTQGGKEVC